MDQNYSNAPGILSTTAEMLMRTLKRSKVRGRGETRYGGGVISGSGGVQANIPLGPRLGIQPWMNWDYAHGKESGYKVNQFEPSGGVNLNYRW